VAERSDRVDPAAVDPAPEVRLRTAGLRVTTPRLAVLAALERTSGHPDVAAVADAARNRLGALSTQAVYGILAAFTDSGLIRRVEPAGSPARFETRVHDNHHHLVCRVCGDIRDVDCHTGSAPCLEPVDRGGFAIDEAEVTYWGVCPDCHSNDKEPAWPRSSST
jgi:Fur family transcriptional regulator, stress-responsive regulator